MTTAQHKIGSGFGAETTAAEVVAEIDLTGKLAIVTGGYSGIGLETTRALTAAGAHVVVPARRRAAAEEALRGWENVEVDELDLSDLDSVRAFAERFLASGRGIDTFIGSAGIMASPETRVGPGWEAQDRKSTRLNSSHVEISYAVFCLKKKKMVSQSRLCC